MKRHKAVPATEGFTLIEVLVAISILSIGILAMYSMQLAAVHTNYLGGSVTQSGNFSSSQIEEIYSLDYSADRLSKDQKGKAVLQYQDDDGAKDAYGVDTGKDTDKKLLNNDLPTELSNGLPRDFGLNRTGLNKKRQSDPAQQPDWITVDGRFLVAYNVVQDLPIKGIKKIRVHTLDTSTSMQNPVSFDLLKNDDILQQNNEQEQRDN